MTQSGLDNFGVYQHALALFDLVVADMRLLQKEPLCYRLCSQQIALDRIHRAGMIVGGLTNTINALRADRKPNVHPPERVKEASEDYGSEEYWRMSPVKGQGPEDEASPDTRLLTPDTRPPPPDTL